MADVYIAGAAMTRFGARPDSLADMMAEDVILMVPDQPVQEGKAACAAFVHQVLSCLLSEFNRRITYVSAEIRVLGDFAFDRGTFSFTMSRRSGGYTTEETGKYLFLYSRTAGRSWEMARLIVNLDARGDEFPDDEMVEHA